MAAVLATIPLSVALRIAPVFYEAGRADLACSRKNSKLAFSTSSRNASLPEQRPCDENVGWGGGKAIPAAATRHRSGYARQHRTPRQHAHSPPHEVIYIVDSRLLDAYVFEMLRQFTRTLHTTRQ